MSKKGCKNNVSENFDDTFFRLSFRYYYIITSFIIKIRYDYRLINFK